MHKFNVWVDETSGYDDLPGRIMLAVTAHALYAKQADFNPGSVLIFDPEYPSSFEPDAPPAIIGADQRAISTALGSDRATMLESHLRWFGGRWDSASIAKTASALRADMIVIKDSRLLIGRDPIKALCRAVKNLAGCTTCVMVDSLRPYPGDGLYVIEPHPDRHSIFVVNRVAAFDCWPSSINDAVWTHL